MSQMTLDEIIQDIHAMDEELWHYEARYGLCSQYFYALYKAGKLRDQDPVETRDYTDWVACYEVKRQREDLYDNLVRDALQKAQAQPTVSLAGLNLALTPTLAGA